MIKIINIKNLGSYRLNCSFNNGVSKILDVATILQNRSYLEGIDRLREEEVFSKVRIGEVGEIVWDGIVKMVYNGEVLLMDYDISAEYAYEYGIY